MQSTHKYLVLLLTMLFLQGCAVYAAYGLYRTITDISATLTRIDNSIVRIQKVLDEGKNLKRAADDGTFISTLAEKIPSLIQNEVELVVKEKIENLSSALSLSSLDFTKNALAEDLSGARKAYDEMSDIFAKFTDLMSDLTDSIGEPLQ